MLRIIKFYWPVFITMILLLAFTFYLKSIPDTQCHFTFGQSTALLALYQMSYGLPGLILICSIYTFVFGVYGFRQGRYPPDNVPNLLRETKTGLSAKIVNLIGILLPVFAAFLLYLGIESVDTVAKGRSHAQMNQMILQQCR